VGKPGVKHQFGRMRRKWEDNIMIHLREVGCEDWRWMEQSQVGFGISSVEPLGSATTGKR
jgi:hypothetical protein